MFFMRNNNRLTNFVAVFPLIWLMTALPLVCLLLYLIESFPSNEILKASIFLTIPLHVIATLCMIFGVIFFVSDSAHRSSISDSARIIWVGFMILTPITSVPLYWHFVYRRQIVESQQQKP